MRSHDFIKGTKGEERERKERYGRNSNARIDIKSFIPSATFLVIFKYQGPNTGAQECDQSAKMIKRNSSWKVNLDQK